MRLLLTVLLIFIVFVGLVWAQPGMPSGPTQVPIDGGLGLLAAAGGSYAIYKLRNRDASE